MPKRIKHISELPDWFRLEKYNSAKRLDASGWYEQLVVRKNSLILIPYNQNDELQVEDTHIFRDLLKLIHDNPIVDTSNNDLLWCIGDNALEELKPKKPNYTLGIHPLTMYELFMILKSVIPEKWKHLQKWHERAKNIFNLKPNSKKTLSRYSYQGWFNEPVYKSSKSRTNAFNTLCINFELPDNLLIEHFKQYLASQRAQMSNNETTKRYRQPDFKDWIRFSILPYLDLKIWEKEGNVSIPNRVMADAIYPSGEGGEETVRKTTAPLANLLITDESLTHLGAQAALEIAEQNNH